MTDALTRPEWLRQRGSFVGASEVAAIMGLSPYQSISELWLSKVQAAERLADDADETTDVETESRFKMFGQLMEPVILGVYEKVTGFEVHRPGLQIFRHPEYPFIAATLDAHAITPFGDKRTAEAKNVDAFKQFRDKDWGNEGSDEVPQHYLVQGVQQMLVREHEGFGTHCDFPVLFGGNDFKIYSVAYDKELAAQLIELIGWFWGLVQTREAPPMDFTARNATKLQKRIYDRVVGETLTITDPAQQRRALELIAIRDYAHEQGKHWIGDQGDGGIKGAAMAELLEIAGNYGRVEIPVSVDGKPRTVAMNRKEQKGFDVPARHQPPIIKTTFEPYQLGKRAALFEQLAISGAPKEAVEQIEEGEVSE